MYILTVVNIDTIFETNFPDQNSPFRFRIPPPENRLPPENHYVTSMVPKLFQDTPLSPVGFSLTFPWIFPTFGITALY